MIDRETETQTRRSARRWDAAAALVAAGLAGGIVTLGLVSTGPASAASSATARATTTTSATVPGSPSTAVAPHATDPSSVAADDPA